MLPANVVPLLLMLPALLLAACQSGSPVAQPQPCPRRDLPYPRPEPAYTGKRARDLSPFTAALAAYTPAQIAARTALVSGKTIPELQTLMDAGELSAVDLVVYYVERIRRYDIDKLNAVLELNPDALRIAQALDDERAAGNVRGPLHGIPVLLKDNIATGDDLHTAAGAAVMLGWDPDRDAFLAAQVRAAGAVILGKTNLSEWANYMDPCMPNGFSTLGGQTRNPYGPFDPSGSSSGSAVAVAADLVTVSVGSETQGSIISPGAANSVVGLKTSLGLVSRDYVIPLLPWQDVAGPMGRTVTDVAVLLSAMTGVDPNDPATADAAALAGVDFTQFLAPAARAGLRVGIPVWDEASITAYFTAAEITGPEAQAQLRASFAEADAATRALGAALTGAGLVVVEVPNRALPARLDVRPALQYGFREAIDAFLAGLGEAAPAGSLAEIVAFNSADLANRAPYGQGHLEAALNTAITAEQYTAMRQTNPATARAALDQLFADYAIDVVVSDVEQTYAPAGYPALTVPFGFAADGMPRGVTLVGSYLAEPQLLAAGYALEQATQARRAPDLDAVLESFAALDKAAP